MFNYEIQQLLPESYTIAIRFTENIFHKEQNIPKKLIPLENEQQLWWVAKLNNEILATVAAWKDKNEWHWGRLAVHEKFRGAGIGKKLVTKSLDELFNNMGIKKIKIDARDITVRMILNKGGKIIGEKTTFYGHPITPMVLEKENWKQFKGKNNSNNE